MGYTLPQKSTPCLKRVHPAPKRVHPALRGYTPPQKVYILLLKGIPSFRQIHPGNCLAVTICYNLYNDLQTVHTGVEQMNPLGSSKEIVQNKLIIMYILQKLDMPVSNNALTKIILEMHLMNWFVLQQCLNELCEGKMVSVAKDVQYAGNASEKATDASASAGAGHEGSSDSYTLTDAGRKTLQYLVTKIHPGSQTYMILPPAGNSGGLLITAEYIPESEDNTVICKMRKRTPIELKAAVGTKRRFIRLRELEKAFFGHLFGNHRITDNGPVVWQSTGEH